MTVFPGSSTRGSRRPILGAAISMAAFLLLAQPLFLLGPLSLLLVLSVPRTPRAWIWIGLTAFGISRIMLGFGDRVLAERVVLATAVIMSGFFSVTSLTIPNTTTLTRVAIGLALTTIAVVGWSWYAGLSLVELLDMVQAMLDEGAQRAFSGDQLAAILKVTKQVAILFPAQMALQASIGAALAWQWYLRIATDRRLPSFKAFRFNDHLIWGAIITGAIALAPLVSPWSVVVWNIAFLWACLYAIRGIAVFAFVAAHWPRPLAVVITLLAIMVLPVGAAMFLVIGLGDTWLDFRTRKQTEVRDHHES